MNSPPPLAGALGPVEFGVGKIDFPDALNVKLSIVLKLGPTTAKAKAVGVVELPVPPPPPPLTPVGEAAHEEFPNVMPHV